MTATVKPLTREERQAFIDAPHYVDGWQLSDAQAQRLFDIAENHARLVAEQPITDNAMGFILDIAAELGGECEQNTEALKLGVRELRAERDALHAENAKLRERVGKLELIDIVFDGPPGPESGRFVEVEDAHGFSRSLGEWVQRDDGYWALRFRAALDALNGKPTP